MKDKVRQTSNIIVLLDIAYMSSREQLSGIYCYQQKHAPDWNIQLIQSDDCRSQDIIRKALSESVDGVIIKAGGAVDLTPILEKKGLPIAVIEQPSPALAKKMHASKRPLAIIGIDNRKVGMLAATHLHALGNFASYLFIDDPNGNAWSRQRGTAFHGALEKCHRKSSSLSLAEFERRLPTIQKPMAIFAGFDLLASNVLKVCRNANLSFPNDAVILSVDNDTFICENTRPTLSSIRLDHEGLGFCAAKALNVLMTGKGARTCKSLPPIDIVVRNSTTYLPPARLLVDRAVQIIESRGSKGIRVKDITSQLGVSHSLIRLRFRQLRNRSLRDTLVSSRLEKAKRLLQTTQYPIKGIAQMCGFSSAVILNHLFKKKTGVSPGQWRKATDGNNRKQGK